MSKCFHMLDMLGVESRVHTTSGDTTMKYTGRILLPLILVFAFLFDMIQHFIMEARLYNPVSLIAIIPFAILGWWLGEQYDHTKYASERDSLTSTYNRRFLFDAFPKLSARAIRKKAKLECCVIDVNEFKSINDTSGHVAGDVVLRNIANTIQRVASKNSVLVRWGGDEFVLLSMVEAEDQRFEIRELEQRLEELSYKMKQNITVSVGTAMYPDEAVELEELIHKADQNMYLSKMNHASTNHNSNDYLIPKDEATVEHLSATELLPS